MPRRAQPPTPAPEAAPALANPALVAPRHALKVEHALALDSGSRLETYSLQFETYGTLAPGRDNAVLVFHSLTKDAHAAGRHAASETREGWWSAAIGPGRMIDTERSFVICADALGSGGSTGPASPDPETGRPYGPSFPVLTIADMVRAARPLLDHLGIEQLHAAIGGCFGGQQALEWAIRYPATVRNVIAISTTAATSPHTIAIFSVMRRLIRSDPNWKGGDYYAGPFPLEGFGNALAAAVPLWMSREATDARFGRRRRALRGYEFSLGSEFDVERFIETVANRAGARLDPNSLMYLMRAVEYFDLEHEFGSLERALAPVTARVLLASYRNDWRYPPAEVECLQRTFEALGRDSRHAVLDSPYGHGAFLYDVSSLEPLVRGLLDQSPAERQPSPA
jgi:homoserine O-acetyltransferase